VFRENRVPHYQRLFQNHDGKRQWWKVSHDRTTCVRIIQWQQSNNKLVQQTSRSGYIMYPYLLSVYGLGAGEWNPP
jgi:hypothetical protein